LNSRITRLSNEREALRLQKEVNEASSSKGSKFFRTLGKEVIAPSAIQAGKTVLTNYLTKVATKAMGLDKSDISDAEKAFQDLKNSLGMDILEINSHANLREKPLILFIVSIFRAVLFNKTEKITREK
jgi:hypothetical protein